MGQEIDASGFSDADFARFRDRLALETASLRDRFVGGALSQAGPLIGFELEAWLVDRHCFPAPHNQSFLARLADPLVVAELSRFNIEVNGTPQPLAGDGLWRLEQELAETWGRCVGAAHDEVDTVVAIGTLPTLRESDLCLANLTPSNRYAALNREVLKARGGRPLDIAIDSTAPGGHGLRSTHDDLMLEAATTSFQLHLQIPPDRIAAYLNASAMLAAPLIALSANSPFLFGRQLWHETRIPLFEQALGDEPGHVQRGAIRRVTFGDRYADDDPTVLFAENLELFRLLLPVLDEEPGDRFACLRLHNGTIWRWNRLLVGFDLDEGGEAGGALPHLRIENRVMPAGPSVIDMLANAAFWFGAVHALARVSRQAEEALPHATARAGFYAAARDGLDAEIGWLDGRLWPVTKVIEALIPVARDGLLEQGVGEELAERYLDVVATRVAARRNGAAWQIAHHRRHGDLFRLTAEYLEHQRSGMAVHEWPL
ncbi:MAG: glutamate--cysteine ligase [Sphingomonadales bacterium]|nr:glutamate--cysteine ligase [Sphingomonadales bacterium]MBD3773117.1 glutamate--cysteine ligase [Paracoccaceae bacterium]